jgi:hypothetical protein
MDEPTRIVAGDLELRFVRSGDRYGHRVLVRSGDAHVPLLESVEGRPDDAWPPSPPFQQLHVEQRRGGVAVALLVGAAGMNHWSGSFELDPRCHRLSVEVAVRLAAQPVRLASTYIFRTPASGWGSESVDGTAVWMLAESQVWRLESLGSAIVPRENRNGLMIVRPPVSGPWPQTVRWQYTIQRGVS